jgi:NitT/TauT family transport system ATP-binding protein
VIVLSKGQVLREIDIPIPRPRGWDELTDRDDFKRLSAEVLHMVRAA